MKIVECILLIILIIAGVSAPLMKRPLTMIIVFSSFGLVMSVIWMLLQSPDLAITEAAVGAGVSAVLFYSTLRKINALDGTEDDK